MPDCINRARMFIQRRAQERGLPPKKKQGGTQKDAVGSAVDKGGPRGKSDLDSTCTGEAERLRGIYIYIPWAFRDDLIFLLTSKL